MGMCLEGTDRVSCEARRESFIIHTADTSEPHLELEYSDLPHLVLALAELANYLVLERGAGQTPMGDGHVVGSVRFEVEQNANQFNVGGFLKSPEYPFADGVVA